MYRPAYFIYRTGYEGSNPYGPIAYRGSARSYCALRLDRLISLVSACWRNEGICHRQLATCCCWSDGATAHFHRLKSLVLCSVQVITSVLHHQLICFCSPAAVIFQLRVLGVEWGGGGSPCVNRAAPSAVIYLHLCVQTHGTLLSLAETQVIVSHSLSAGFYI